MSNDLLNQVLAQQDQQEAEEFTVSMLHESLLDAPNSQLMEVCNG